MVTVSKQFGITGPVPFIDVDVSADNRLYLDPRAVRLINTSLPFADEAVRCADTFLS